MFVLNVNGQRMSPEIAQTIGREYVAQGGHTHANANGDRVINISTERYVRLVELSAERQTAHLLRTAQRFNREADAMLRSARRESHPRTETQAPAPRAPQPQGASSPITADDVSELDRISNGAYDNLSWLNGVL